MNEANILNLSEQIRKEEQRLVSTIGASATAPKPPAQFQIRRYCAKPGQEFEMRDHAQYRVMENGSYVRINGPELTKKQRNKLKKGKS